MEPYEIRTRPSARSIRTRLVAPAVLVVLAAVLLVAAATTSPGDRAAPIFFAAVLGLPGIAILLQQPRLLWAGMLVRIDADGVVVRRGRGGNTLPWDQVARVQLVAAAARLADGREQPVLVLSWVPVDDEAVPDGPPYPGEEVFQLNPARARLATMFNGRDRSRELLELLARVREHQPHVEVLDAVLGTTTEPEPVHGPTVVVSTAHGGWGLLPDVVAGLRAAGLRPALLGGRHDLTAEMTDQLARVLGAQVRWVDDDSGRPDDAKVRVALASAAGLVVVGAEPGVPGPPTHLLDAPRLVAALDGAPAVVVVRDPDALAGAVERWDGATVVATGRLTAGTPTGAVSAGRQPVPTAPLAAHDLVALVVALIGRPVGGLLHVGGGAVRVDEAVAALSGTEA